MKELFLKAKAKWIAFSNILMKINTRILLFVIYFLALGPIATLMRLFGQDMLDKKIDLTQESFFKPRKQNHFELDRYKRQF